VRGVIAGPPSSQTREHGDYRGERRDQPRGDPGAPEVPELDRDRAPLGGLLGIGNTLALSIFERTRELGVMRAVGMTRQQLRATIRWESVIIACRGRFSAC
jgi:hypothetical protein